MWTSSSFICPAVGDMPQSLPRFLVARCGDPSSWIYSDQKCDGTNNCGDCSDELSPGRGLGTGQAKADWRISEVLLPPLLVYHEELFHPCLNASGDGVLTTTSKVSFWMVILWWGQMRKPGPGGVRQRVHTKPNWDFGLSFPPLLCTSQPP